VIALEQKGMSKSSCNKLRVLLGMVGRYAMEEGITLNNPAEGLSTIAKQKKTKQVFDEEKISAIKQSTLPAADVALILISCGCRPGELFSVPLADCKDDYFIGGSKTEAGKNRVIPIGSEGLVAYQRMRDSALSNGCSLLIDGYSGRNKNALHFGKRDWRELMTEIGCDGMTPYNCRHTFITRSIKSGISLPVLEQIVGHVDRETTKIYTHLQAKDIVSALNQTKE
jgi:site-specific recombinase XerD